MRVTKSELLRQAQIAEDFASLPFRCVALSGVERVRGRAGFIAVHEYGRGMHVQRGEIGMVGRVRFKVDTRGRMK